MICLEQILIDSRIHSHETMKIYYAGLNNSKLFSDDDGDVEPVVEKFRNVEFPEIEDLEIGWNYMILWRDKKIYVSGKIHLLEENECEDSESVFELLPLPEKVSQ